MGKAIGGLPEEAPLAGVDAEESFALGAWLARQRELRGISREELSTLTRLPMRSLERLDKKAASFTRCASPPESVVADCPSLR